MKNLDKIIKETVSYYLKESLYSQQWEEEISSFFEGVENGKAIIANNTVAVEWNSVSNDPRFICYVVGDHRLTDDHFSQQHSRHLSLDEIRELQYLCKTRYNFEFEIPIDFYYQEMEMEEGGY